MKNLLIMILLLGFAGFVQADIRADVGANIKVGDTMSYRTHAKITALGETRVEDATVVKKVMSVSDANNIQIQEIKNGTIENYNKLTRETLWSLVSSDKSEFKISPQEIIDNCDKLSGAKSITVQWQGKDMKACELTQVTDELNVKRVYAMIPLYIYSYEYNEKGAEDNSTDGDIEVSFFAVQ